MLKKKFMEVDYNMLVQNYVQYSKLSKNNSPYGVVVVRNSNPHTYNLGYLGYLGDQIK
jgi:hypothetical protein